MYTTAVCQYLCAILCLWVLHNRTDFTSSSKFMKYEKEMLLNEKMIAAIVCQEDTLEKELTGLCGCSW